MLTCSIIHLWGSQEGEYRLCAIRRVDVIPSQISLASQKWATTGSGLVDITGDSCAFASRAAAAASPAVTAAAAGWTTWLVVSLHSSPQKQFGSDSSSGGGREAGTHGHTGPFLLFSFLFFFFLKEEAECAWTGSSLECVTSHIWKRQHLWMETKGGFAEMSLKTMTASVFFLMRFDDFDWFKTSISRFCRSSARGRMDVWTGSLDARLVSATCGRSTFLQFFGNINFS